MPYAFLYTLPRPAPYQVHDRYSNVAWNLIEQSTPEIQDFLHLLFFFFQVSGFQRMLKIS